MVDKYIGVVDNMKIRVYEPTPQPGQRMSEVQEEAIKLRLDAFRWNGRLYLTLSLTEVSPV